MKWILPESDIEASVAALVAELKLHPLAAKVLVHRGYRTPREAKAFLSDALTDLPDPLLMKGMPAAVQRVAAAVLGKQKVTLYGDYDVDGVSSTALLSTFLKQLGHPVETYIPHRLGEGYGLNSAAIEKIAADGTKLLITLDCGITSHAEVALAQQLGVDVVVVDHHAVPETMPPAIAVLNPLQPGCEYPTKFLCAGGVTFNLCIGLRKHLREREFFAGRTEPNLKSLMDLVALATVADVVPLVGVNRLLVRHGLRELTAGNRPGVRALKDVADLTGEQITSGHVGFRLGPRINAAGRLDDASIGLKLLCAETYEEALPLARQLDAANNERRQIEKAMIDAAIEQSEAAISRGARGLVLASDDWHPGVVGIVASRMVERFHRPAVLIGIREGVGRGSARSIEGFHLYDALKSCSGNLSRFGGHKHAAGLSILPEHLPTFIAAFEKIALERLQEEDLVGRCKIDAVVRLQDLDEAAVAALAQLAPFGMGNPEPVLISRGLVAAPRVLVNKQEGEVGHLKLSLEAAPQLDVIGFRLADRLPLTEGPVDLAYQISVDEFRGISRVQLKLKDLRAAV
jgi:single-stranded-DNA-specific exonuclease